MRRLSLKDKICLGPATLFGVGYTPLCPGTASSLLGVLAFVLIKSRVYFAIFTVACTIIAFLVSGRAEKIYGEKDCKRIVIDDFSGMLITFLFMPHEVNLLFIAAGFFLFRMLDMLKIPPASQIENLPGAKGIVGDDIIAGVYSCCVLQGVRTLLNILS